VIGIVAGFFLYWKSLREPAPYVIIDSLPVPLIDTAKTAGLPLKITKLDGTEISKKLYSMRIYVCNFGTGGLKGADILEPLTVFSLDTQMELLTASIEKVSRAVVTPSTKILTNTAQFSFSLLEPQDGFSSQIAYLAPAPTTPHLKGTLFGVKSIPFLTIQKFNLQSKNL
jgi:hypothetical protein